MRLVVERLELDDGDVSTTTPTRSSLGDHEIELSAAAGWGDGGGAGGGPGAAETWSWSVARSAPGAGAVRAARVVFRVVDAQGPIRMLRHGYQSWSPSDVAVFGVDRDPSLAPGSVELIRAINQADQRIVSHADELRSEWVTVLVDDGGRPIVVGFDGGDRHDGTLRLRTGPSGVELCAEAFLGDAVLGSGERRVLHAVTVATGAPVDELLAAWASMVGRRAGARLDAGHQVGWCSWYHYFHGVTRADIDANLTLSDDWPFDVFQVDDGFQSAIGDWLTVAERFGGDLPSMAASIAGHGRRPGLWLAPFLAAPDSRVALEHPEWLARGTDGEPLVNMFNPPWEGGRGGLMYGLDTSREDVREHLRALGATLVDMGFEYLKLDFTFSPSFDGVWSDASFTPAQRVRAGFDAIRTGVGDDVFLLGCGVPLSNSVGVVDANRIGADVAPAWSLGPVEPFLAGYAGTQPATRHAWSATAIRSFLHRRVWMNDPDCVMLRTRETELTPEAARTWARAVGVSGGMVIVSDDLALLDGEARSVLDEAIALSQVADVAARAGDVATCPDLLDGPEPRRLRSPAGDLVVDPTDGRSTFRTAG